MGELLDSRGFPGQYDLVYLPFDFKRLVARGYAFVNMVSHDAARAVVQRLWGLKSSGAENSRALNFCWSDIQGLALHVDRYKNCPVMHDVVPDEYKPCLISNGVQI